jgi:organic radical activating enzyme
MPFIMSFEIIKANPDFKKEAPFSSNFLEVAEFFCDTIQGENFIGYPAAFLRLQNCTLNCAWCDTSEVWRYGNPYSFDEIFELMDQADLPRKLHDGQHLILTGGSPLKQQIPLINFIDAFITLYGFGPYIEVENECVVRPLDRMINYVDCWNNSPKLSTSGNPKSKRYKPEILKIMSELDNSWFKFVITEESDDDWNEIVTDYLDPGLIRKDQIVLMPCGATKLELEENRQRVVDLAVEFNVRYTSREHIILWDKRTGV